MGKIFDALNYDSGPIQTKLELVLERVASEIGQTVTPTYYDFRYPNATNMLIIADRDIGGGFTFKLPNIYTYYEAGYYTTYYVYLNGEFHSGPWGTFDLVNKLPPNQTHEVRGPSRHVAIILLYGETS